MDKLEQNYKIIGTLIERIIIPKYPMINLKKIDSFFLTNHRTYDVRFITKEKIPAELQMEIDTEIKRLFKMAGIDVIERYGRNNIAAWFKTPREKDWSFHSKGSYHHV